VVVVVVVVVVVLDLPIGRSAAEIEVDGSLEGVDNISDNSDK